jgi:hypothetical protein
VVDGLSQGKPCGARGGRERDGWRSSAEKGDPTDRRILRDQIDFVDHNEKRPVRQAGILGLEQATGRRITCVENFQDEIGLIDRIQEQLVGLLGTRAFFAVFRHDLPM